MLSLFVLFLVLGSSSIQMEDKDSSVPSNTQLIAAKEAVVTELALDFVDDTDARSRILQRYASVLEILLSLSRELSVLQPDSQRTMDNPPTELDLRLVYLRPFEEQLQLDLLLRKIESLQLHLVEPTRIDFPVSPKAIDASALLDLLTIWDRLQGKILECKIQSLETRIARWKSGKRKAPSEEIIVDLTRSLMQHYGTSESSRQGPDLRMSQGELPDNNSLSPMDATLAKLVAQGLKLSSDLEPITNSHDPALEQISQDFNVFSAVVSKTRRQTVAIAARDIFQDRSTIQNLVEIERQDGLQSLQPRLQSGNTQHQHASVALLDLIESNLTDRIEVISDTEIPANMFVRWVTALWNYELTFGEDVSIKMGEILSMILSIATGIFFAFLLSKLIGKFILPRFGISPGVAFAWRLIIRNTMALLFIFIAFQFFNVPLTAFAFVGGAAALAVGFGSKDIANNFMSGLIILTEQPVRINDVIMYDSKQCLVTYIGLRSTRLRNLENHELVVPNSVLIDRMVTNLTLSDKRVRLVLPLEVDRTEVATDSIPRILEALTHVNGVYQEASPAVYLKSVDTYYLNFEIHITIEFEALTEIPQVQSRVLTALASLFPSSKSTDQSTSTDDLPATGSTVDSMTSEPPPISRNRREIEHQINVLKRSLKTI
jgi:small-conductance mechanosensitive channel